MNKTIHLNLGITIEVEGDSIRTIVSSQPTMGSSKTETAQPEKQENSFSGTVLGLSAAEEWGDCYPQIYRFWMSFTDQVKRNPTADEIVNGTYRPMDKALRFIERMTRLGAVMPSKDHKTQDPTATTNASNLRMVKDFVTGFRDSASGEWPSASQIVTMTGLDHQTVTEILSMGLDLPPYKSKQSVIHGAKTKPTTVPTPTKRKEGAERSYVSSVLECYKLWIDEHKTVPNPSVFSKEFKLNEIEVKKVFRSMARKLVKVPDGYPSPTEDGEILSSRSGRFYRNVEECVRQIKQCPANIFGDRKDKTMAAKIISQNMGITTGYVHMLAKHIAENGLLNPKS